jgi:hypothetical protein
MSKAQNSTTNRRRFLRLAGVTAAATALLAAPALAKGRDDTRLLAMIARIRPLLSAHAAAEERAHATHALVLADPELPHGGPTLWVDKQIASGSALSRRALHRLERARTEAIYRRHSYDVASDEWNRTGHELRTVHLPRLLSMRPRTAEGARDKWRLAVEAFRETDQWEPEDFDEFMVPALLADLERLARKAVRT